MAQTQPPFALPSSTLQSVDPDKAPSELNHHIAGWALIGIGMLVLGSRFSSGLKAFRWALPVLFVGVGLFLAAWSDGEIWPRGNLNWLWLVHHDAEARQHKIYSLLLIAIGIIEFFRMKGSLSKAWRTLAFPVLAVLGAGMLLVHDHTGGSGARLPDAQSYLVNPMLDVDSEPRKPSTLESTSPMIEKPASIQMDHTVAEATTMAMEHSQMAMQPTANGASHSQHQHEMSATMLLVEREHFWFMIVGIAIALFKFISDAKLVRRPVIPYLWPACMILLGFALAVYRE